MPADQVYQTSITINGKIDATLLKALQEVDKGTAQVVKQEKALGVESKKAGETMAKGLSVATAKTKDLANSLKEMMIPLLGISIAFKGFQTIGDTIQAAIDKFRGAKEAAANFQATLEALFARGMAGRVEEFDVAQQARMKERFTRIYGIGLFREAQLELNRAGIALGDEAFAGFIQTTAYLKRDLKITSEDAVNLARKIGMAYALPRGARPDREVLEMLHSMNINIDKFSKLSGPEKLKLIVAGMKNMHYIQERITDAREKDNVELMRARTEEGGLMAQIGKFWEALQTKGELVSEHIKIAFLQPFVSVSEAIQKLLSGPMKDLDDRVTAFGVEMRRIFAPNEADLKLGYRKLELTDPTTFFGNLTKAFHDDILPQLKTDWENFSKWVGDRWAELGKSDNPLLKGLHDGIDNMIGATMKIAEAVGKLAGLSWDALQSAAFDIAKAARDLSNVIDKIPFLPKIVTPGSKEEAAAWEREAAEYEKRMAEKAGGPPHFQFGGIVSAPQVGLVGEAGPESIIPLRQDANTLAILGSTLANLQVNPMDPNAWGHELFDAMRSAPGAFGLSSGYGGPPGFSGYAGGIYYTEYGPALREDQPGGPTYDYNSYHRIGAWPAITGPLQPGDVALGYGAQRFYGVSPGQTFTDTRGNTVRFADRSGSGNPMNEDVFRMAGGGIVSRKILSWLGEAGREAVIPLSGNKGRTALAGALGGPSGHTFNFSPTIHVSGVATDEVVDNLVEQLRANFGRWLDDAAFEHERRAFT